MCYYPLYYGHGSRNLPCLDNRVQKVSRRGFTLIEIMIVGGNHWDSIRRGGA